MSNELPGVPHVKTVRRKLSFEPKMAKAFGTVARESRLARSIAQDDFALLANIDRSYYGKLERGERQPSLVMLFRVAHALGASASSLVERTQALLRDIAD